MTKRKEKLNGRKRPNKGNCLVLRTILKRKLDTNLWQDGKENSKILSMLKKDRTKSSGNFSCTMNSAKSLVLTSFRERRLFLTLKNWKSCENHWPRQGPNSPLSRKTTRMVLSCNKPKPWSWLMTCADRSEKQRQKTCCRWKKAWRRWTAKTWPKTCSKPSSSSNWSPQRSKRTWTNFNNLLIVIHC